METLRFPRRAPLNDDHLRQLSEIRSLREFSCFGTGGGLTDVGISQLKRNRGLESLEVWENQATGKFLASFVGCPLTLLAASSFDRQQGTLIDRELKTLSQFPQLVSLDLGGQTRLSGATLEVISHRSKLRQLTLQGCVGIPSAYFATLGRLQLLSRLDLRDTNAGDVAATSIAQIPRLDRLQMRCEGLTDHGLKALSAAFSLSRLELASEAITDEGVRALGRINRLENLILRSSHVTGTGLGPITSLPNLRDLFLITPGLTDVAFEYLANAKSLRRVRLAHQNHRPPAALSDAGLMKLAKATWLQELWLPRNDTEMTEAQMNRLVELLPKTRVIINTVQWKD